MDTVLRIVGYLLLALSIAGLAVAVRVLRREMPVRTKFDVIRLGISLASALLITVVLSVDTPPVLIGAALVAGTAVGFLQGQGMHVRLDGDQVFARRSVLAILAWGSGMIVAQGAGLLNRAGTVSVGLAVAYFSAAMVGGTMLGRNQAITKARIATAPAAAAVTVLFLLVAPFVPGASGPVGAQVEGFDVEMSADVSGQVVDGDFSEAVSDGSIDLGFTLVGRSPSLGGSDSPAIRNFSGELVAPFTFFEGVAAIEITLDPPSVADTGGGLVLEGTGSGATLEGLAPTTLTWRLEWDPVSRAFSGSADAAFPEAPSASAALEFEGSTTPIEPPTTTTATPAEAAPTGGPAAAGDTFTVTAAMDVPASFSQVEGGIEFDDQTIRAIGFLGTKENRITFEIPEGGGPVTGELEIVHEVDFLLFGSVLEVALQDLFADEEDQPSVEEVLAQVGIDPALVGLCTFDITQAGALNGTFDPASGSLEGTATVTSSFEEVRFEDVSDECVTALEEQSDEPLTPEDFDGGDESEEQTGPFTATLVDGEIQGTITLDDSSLIVFAPPPPSDDGVSAGSAAGASLVGLVGVAGLLGSTMTETGMSTAELTGAVRKEGLGGLARLSPTTEPPPPPPPDLEIPTTTPQGTPEGVGVSTAAPSAAPSAPDTAAPAPATTQPPADPDAPGPRATAKIAPDVTADTPSAPETRGAAPSAPDAPAVEVAPDVVDFSDALPGGAGPREAIGTVAESLADPAAFAVVDIDPQEAVDRLRTAGVGLRDSLNPISRLSDDVAAAIRANPVAGARGLVGADALDRLVDPDVPVGQGGGPGVFGAVDVVVSPEAAGGAGGAGILAGIDLDATGAETIADAGGASANSELLGDIGEDTSELMSDVVEDRGLADRPRPTGPPAGPNWTFRQLDASTAAQLGLPPIALPVRAANADTVFGDTVATDRLLTELDDYLAAHPDQADAYGPVVGELAYVVGIEKGATGSYGEAASHLRVGLQHAPGNLSLLIHYALAQQCLGDYERAAQVYERLERDRRLEHNALMKILAARAHAAAGDHAAARRAVDRLADDPAVESLLQGFSEGRT